MLSKLVAKLSSSSMKLQKKSSLAIEAIINSMTPKERQNPDIINQSRRRRIAAGSGTKLDDVNRLMKQFDQTRKMMKMVSGMGSSKMAQMANAMKAMKGGGLPKF